MGEEKGSVRTAGGQRSPAMSPLVNAAKFRPITVTDVQSDGRPLALPGDSPSSPHVCAAVAAARDS
eukprot:scaffold7421_cov131-Isochrysis_galbana.AAC.1